MYNYSRIHIICIYKNAVFVDFASVTHRTGYDDLFVCVILHKTLFFH